MIISPCFTRRLCRTTRLIRALPSSRSSSARTIKTVSFRFFPLTKTVSPRKSCKVSIVLLDKAIIELSSLTASVTLEFVISGKFRLSPLTALESTYINELGFFFFFRIAVAVSKSYDERVKIFSSRQREAQTYLFLLGARGITLHRLSAQSIHPKNRE